jgi:predicted Ser/Thr protein kinase
VSEYIKIFYRKKVICLELKKIGLGATADVYRYNEKSIIKIFHDNISETAIDKECEINKSIQGLGLNVPLYGGRVVKDGRQAIIMEYIEGKNMFHKMYEPDVDLNIKKNKTECVWRIQFN